MACEIDAVALGPVARELAAVAPGAQHALPRISGPTQPYRHQRRAARERIRPDRYSARIQERKLTCPVPWEETAKAKARARTRRRERGNTCSGAASSAASPPRSVKEIDYKDVDILKDFVNENGKIIPARITGTKARYQRQLSDAIKRARFLALLPYTDLH